MPKTVSNYNYNIMAFSSAVEKECDNHEILEKKQKEI